MAKRRPVEEGFAARFSLLARKPEDIDGTGARPEPAQPIGDGG